MGKGYLDNNGEYREDNKTVSGSISYKDAKPALDRQRSIRKEIKASVKEKVSQGINENKAVNEARAEANSKYGHTWRNDMRS